MIAAVNKIDFEPIAKKILIAIFAVVVASLLRKYLLSSLENKVVWITYYPAVMTAAIFGGVYTGLLSAILTCLIVIYGWQFFCTLPFINSHADWIGLFVFLLNCTMVSIIAEYSQRQKLKANKAKDQAEMANKAKSIFLANMSHELRTPLNAILGFTQLMKLNTSIPPEEQKNLEVINRSGEHLLNLINNVLDISKIEAGHTTVTILPFNLIMAFYDIELIMSQRAEAKGLLFYSEIDTAIPAVILSDELKLKQILINLLGNAIKFTPHGHVRLMAKVQTNVQGNLPVLLIEVEDTGIGISEDDTAKIFDPFMQVGDLSANNGTGLGLTICKQFTELLGGSISIHSKLNVGSSFRVQIPVKFAAKTESKIDNYQHIKSLAITEPEYRILIVEDQIENWLLLQRILENVSFKVKVAINGAEGVETFKTWNPHLIFMDVRMPVMDGLEASSTIRKLESGNLVKIVGVSAHVFADGVKNVLDAGMDDFIKKPYIFSDIYGSLQKHLGVSYIFNDLTEISQPGNNHLTVEMLKQLDNALLQELREYIENLEPDKLAHVIERISMQNKELANNLNYFISNLKFTEIFRLLNQIEN